MVEVTDSGFAPENIADAEWLWTNLPTFPRNWSTLPTHEKALIIHTAIRYRETAAKAERDRIVAWLRADADQTEIEAESILAKLELPDLERGAWQSLVATKRGIANAIAALESQP